MVMVRHYGRLLNLPVRDAAAAAAECVHDDDGAIGAEPAHAHRGLLLLLLLHVLRLGGGDGVVVEVADAAGAAAVLVCHVASREETDVVRGRRVGA